MAVSCSGCVASLLGDFCFPSWWCYSKCNFCKLSTLLLPLPCERKSYVSVQIIASGPRTVTFRDRLHWVVQNIQNISNLFFLSGLWTGIKGTYWMQQICLKVGLHLVHKLLALQPENVFQASAFLYPQSTNTGVEIMRDGHSISFTNLTFMYTGRSNDRFATSVLWTQANKSNVSFTNTSTNKIRNMKCTKLQLK